MGRKGMAIILTALVVAGAAFVLWRAFIADSGPIRYEHVYASPQLEMMTIQPAGRATPRIGEPPGRWRETDAPTFELDNKKAAELATLPYLQGYKKATENANVTRYKPEEFYNGLSVYNSGHAPIAFVIDMEGRVLHKWEMRIDDVWPEVPRTVHSLFWRRVHPYPNGDLLAIFEGIGIVKLDKDSNILWANRDGHHHQAFVAEDGRIYALKRRAKIVPRINPRSAVVADDIAILSPDGEPLGEVSILECFENSKYVDMLRKIPRNRDLMHTNSIYVFDGSQANQFPYYKKDYVLLSILLLDAIAIVDMAKRQVVWAASGGDRRDPGVPGDSLTWKFQHDPTVLPNGNILLFDNVGRGGKSKIVQYDPRSGVMEWVYAGTPNDELYSRTCGTAKRLPNGNILIAESDNGRALEISAEGQVVWEFYNPFRAGPNKELVATLFAMDRVDNDFFPWLQTD